MADLLQISITVISKMGTGNTDIIENGSGKVS
jgi:hypothetical protein